MCRYRKNKNKKLFDFVPRDPFVSTAWPGQAQPGFFCSNKSE